MRHLSVRIALVVLYVGGLASVAYQTSLIDRESDATRVALASFDARTDETAHSIASLRAAQQSYVAAGQDVEYRITRAQTVLETLNEQLVELKRATTNQQSATAVGTVAQTVDGIVELDSRVREYAVNGQVLMASDIIFTDGVDLLDAAQEHLATARTAEHARAEATLAALGGRRQTMMVSVAGASLVVVALLLFPGARTPGGEHAEPASTPAAERTETAGLALSGVPSSPEARPDAPVQADTTLSMKDVASVCCDLARVQSATDLPDLLARSARLLEASGLVVWLTAPGGDRLLPALTHGYDPAVVKRMGTILRDADNATASAYRDAALRTVAADGESSAAIVVPLVGGSGCVGAMALEMAPGTEEDVGRQGVATILATQLAVLISEPPATPMAEPRAADAQSGST